MNGLFLNWDKDNTGYLTLASFKEFYRQSAIDKPQTVRTNRIAWKYNSELLPVGTPKPTRDPLTLLRITIPRNQEYFSFFFDLLDHETEVAEESWDFIRSLITSPALISNIL